jgi:hypothetical protein
MMFRKKILSVAVATISGLMASVPVQAYDMIFSPLDYRNDQQTVFEADAQGNAVVYSGEIVYASNASIWLSAYDTGDCEWNLIGQTYKGNNVLMFGAPEGIHDVSLECTQPNGEVYPESIKLKVVAPDEAVSTTWTIGPPVLSLSEEGMVMADKPLYMFAADNSRWMFTGTSMFAMFRPSMLYSGSSSGIGPWLAPENEQHVAFNELGLGDTFGSSRGIVHEVADSIDGSKTVILKSYFIEGLNSYSSAKPKSTWVGAPAGSLVVLNPKVSHPAYYEEMKKALASFVNTNQINAVSISEDGKASPIGLETAEVNVGITGNVKTYRASMAGSQVSSNWGGHLVEQYKVVALDPNYPYIDEYLANNGLSDPLSKGVMYANTSGWRYELNAVNEAAKYDVFVSYPGQSSPPASSVQYVLETSSGNVQFMVNETMPSNGWIKLGSFFFDDKARIQTTNAAFDQIKIVKSTDLATGSQRFTPGKSILVDFGTSAYVTTGNWNNMTAPTTLGVAIPNAILSDGSGSSDISIAVYNKFVSSGTAGKTTNTVGFNTLATRDYFYTKIGDSGEITLSNLNSSGTYTARIFASRTGTDSPYGRLSKYSSGAQSVTLNDADNTSRIAELTGLVPDANGRISIHVDVAGTSRNAHISALELKRVQ